MTKENTVTAKITYYLNRVLDIGGHRANLLDLFLTSCPDKCSTEELPSMGSSDYSLVYIRIDAKPLIS